MSFLLVLGTHNQKKRRELELLLSDYSMEIKTLGDFPEAIEVEETGQTFAENACLKAVEQARNLGQWVLGEDSGLSVDALNGEPGVYSARYSGVGATDERNNQKLLEALGDTPLEKRTARYTSHLALADPRGEVQIECQDHCEGLIRLEPAGSAGFGYDPLFEVREYHRTFAQMGDAVKSVLSHRARAFRKLVPRLVQLLGGENSIRADQ